MNQSDQHVIDAIDALDVGPGPVFRVLKRLGDGPTNETWLVTRDQERYVLRLLKPLAAAIGLSLEEELTISTAAAKHGLAPPIVASCVDHGCVLSRYVDGRTWALDDLRYKDQLSRLAGTLRRVHRLDCKARPLNLRLTVERYAKRSTDSRAGMWVESVFEQLDRINPRGPVVCHNDVNCANVIDDGQLILLDWEYAALGDPLFDLAVVVTHHELDAETSEYFLSAYLGHIDADASADLIRWRAVYQNLVALWLSGLDVEATNN